MGTVSGGRSKASGNAAPSTKLIKAKTNRGKRELEKRAPKLVEDPKKALLLFGNRTSQVIKDVLTDLHKMKYGDAVKYTKKNDEARPFEAGGEAFIERWADKGDCSLFALGTHTKKRPHNLVLGRMFDHHLYDMMELGVVRHRGIQSFGSAASAQIGNKPCFVFAGDGFETEPVLKQARSLLLDFFRGRQVQSVNLGGLDCVVFVTHRGSDTLLLRQYRIRLKKSGTKIPRVELSEMGPLLDLAIRRHRAPPAELEKEALRKPKELHKKKEKNVSSDLLDGRVGRIYMPKQDLGELALHKMKGLKRERRHAAEAAAAGGPAGGGGAAEGGAAKKKKVVAAAAAAGGGGE